MPGRHSNSARGFTLLELLVAVAILAVVAVGSYRLLFDTIRTRDHGMAQEQALAQVQRTVMLIQRDLLQIAPRPIRDEFGDTQPAFLLSAEQGMEFTRRGWRNPLGEVRSDMVRVRYRVEGGKLLREHWPVLDRARTSTPVRIVLLDDVSDFHLQVFANKDWNATWPLLGSATRNPAAVPPPDAVDIRFSLKPFGEVRRVIALPEQNETTSS
ncbi:MAG: ral secretion pathway protein GspJ [Moraxellaceae bacterium]|jgi:general secretion pathway protein J|nr:ral secretion pathway protein GspJ [Moraxellaceae bacterium]